MVQKWRAMKCESADGDSTVPYLFVVQLQGDERQALFDRYYCNGKDTPQSVLDYLNISEVVNPDEGTFTYTSTISMDLWNDTFELPQDDTYMMPIEDISRILGWEFWTGDNVLKIVSDEPDDTNPDNFVIDTTVREETCYDVGTWEEIACD